MTAHAIRPRRLVHRGVVEVSALLIEDGAIGTLRAKARVVKIAAGSDVYRVGRGWIVRLRRPVSLAVRAAPGQPFVAARKHPRILASAPIEEDELEDLLTSGSVPRGDVFVEIQGGEAAVLTLEEAVDPADWLDVDGYAVAESMPLGELPAPPAPPAFAPARDVRALLAQRGPSADLGALVGALRARALAAKADGVDPTKDALGRLAGGKAPKRTGDPPGDAGPSRFGAALGAVFAVLAAMLSVLAKAGSSGSGSRPGGGAPANAGGAGAPERGLASVPQEPPGPTWADRMRSRLLDWAARALVATRLARVLGKKHAEHLSRMLALFEEGNLDEALRWAIPLADDTPSDGTNADPMFLPPSPRETLDINLSGLAPRRRQSLGLEETLFDHLKKRYRAAFEKLSEAGRHKDAAFVLVELLGETAEAVSYLERHREYALAAELAEAKKLAPELVVRQWMLAGDRARAIAHARRHDAFEAAIARLDTGDKEQAAVLRVLWAEHLASAGSYPAAVDAIWPVESGRHLALAWIERAIAVGGLPRARMLARKLALAPEEWPAIRDAVRDVLADDSPDGAAARLAFARALLALGSTPPVAILAREAARALAGEAAERPVIDSLAERANDPVFRADLAAAPVATPEPEARSLQAITRSIADRGAVAVLDAALLPDGVLVSLGEAGSRILRPDGRTVARFLEPAHSIVPSTHGTRAIALAPRGKGLYRIARIDVAGRRVESWCDARLDAFASDFDGETWLVAEGSTLHAIDVLDAGWRSLWSVTEPGMRVTAISIEPATSPAFSVVRERTGPFAGLEVHTYNRRGPTLRRRRRIEPPTGVERVIHGAPSADGKLPAIFVDDKNGRSLAIHSETVWDHAGDSSDLESLGAFFADGLLLTLSRSDRALSVALRSTLSSEPTFGVAVHLEGARRAQGRRFGDRILVWDDRGRLLLCSSATRRVISEWRIA